MTRRRGRELLAAAGVVSALASPVWAWKPTTHQVVAVEGAMRLPAADPLRATLLANAGYLRAGSMGPDLFYPTPPYWQYSDLAHYCETDELVRNLVKKASGNPKQEAFAYGWLSHNVADSVAHPWANGFTGQPYELLQPPNARNAALNAVHFKIEDWVDAQVYARGSPNPAERFRQARTVIDAFKPYFEPEIQQLMIDAYDATYSQRACQRRYQPLKKNYIEQGARALQAYLGAGKVASAAPNIVDIDLVKHLPGDRIKLLRSTWEDYIGRTEQYIERAFREPGKLENLDLDIGVTAADAPRELGSLWGSVLDREGSAVNVFNVPGRWFNNGQPPSYQDFAKCDRISKICAAGGLRGPGGDTPDDNVSPGIPAAPLSASPIDATRLALKKGQRWPAARFRLARLVEAIASAPDEAAGAAALEAWQRAFAEAEAQDPDFAGFASAHRGNPAPLLAAVDVAMLDGNFLEAARAVVETFDEPAASVAAGEVSVSLAETKPVLVIPSGGLYGLSQPGQFRAGLESYVASGGTAIVFAQQRGSDFSVLPTPNGEPIRGYGWFEDNSCYTNGAYIDSFHPILASQAQSLVTSNLDGYFDSIPENATVLLRRAKNGYPSMFLYPYGQGFVVVSSSYDDWGGFNQTGPGARAIIRDAIAWAKKPADLPINLPGSAATIQLQIKNVTDISVAQAKLILLSPSRDRVISEQTVPVSLLGGSSGEVEFSHTLPADAELGIYHLDYELLDADGVTVQPPAEDDSGRIVVARPPTASPFRPSDLSVTATTPDGEEVLTNGTVRLRYQIINRLPRNRPLRIWRRFGRAGPVVLADELSVPADATLTRETLVPLAPTYSVAAAIRIQLEVFEEGGVEHPLVTSRPPGETGAFQLAEIKGVRTVAPRASVSVTADKPLYADGETAALTVTVKNQLRLAWDGVVEITTTGPGSGQTAFPLSLAADGSASLTAPFRVSYPGTPALARVRRGVEDAGGGTLFLKTARAELRNLGVVTPAWSREQANLFLWTLENVGLLPIPFGTLRAQIRDEDGLVIWEETRPLVLGGAPEAKGTFEFTAPPIPPELSAGSFVVSAENGYGQVVTASADIRSSLATSARTASPEYAAGESGELIVSVNNSGTIQGAGTASASIDGIGELAPVSFSVSPGQVAELRLPFSVPADVDGGAHRGLLRVTGAPDREFVVRVQAPRVELTAGAGPHVAGTSVPVAVRNAGGSRGTLRVSLALDDVAGVSMSTTLMLDPGAQETVFLALPAELRTRSYVLLAQASDEGTGAFSSTRLAIPVSGAQAAVTVAVDRDVYIPGEALELRTAVSNTGVALAGARLHVEIVAPCTEEEMEPQEAGEPCFQKVVWSKDYPLDLAGGEMREFFEALTAPGLAGQYEARAALLTAAGAALATANETFLVVTGALRVSLQTDARSYKSGAPVAVSGSVTNAGPTPQPDLKLRVFRRESFFKEEIHSQPLSLLAGETQAYAFTGFAPELEEELSGNLDLVAEIQDSGDTTLAQASWSVSIGVPRLAVTLSLPDPPARLVPASPRMVEVSESDLDDLTRSDSEALEAELPFPVTIAGTTYATFRQSVDGFVELVPAGQEATGQSGACLSDFGADVIAPGLADLDASSEGFVGYKLYPAQSSDAAGRVFPDDTLVFFWDAPAQDGTGQVRLQVLLASDGLIRIDSGSGSLPTACDRTGIALAGSVFASALPSPFGLRVETGLPRGVVPGSIRVANTGSFAGAVTLDYGRVGGTRTTTALTLGPGETRTLTFEEQIAPLGEVELTVETSGDFAAPVSLSKTLSAVEGLRIVREGETFLESGFTTIPVTLVKTGGVAGPVQVTFTLAVEEAGTQTLQRTYDLEPGVVVADALPFLLGEDSYTLSASADVRLDFEPSDLAAAPRESAVVGVGIEDAGPGVLGLFAEVINIGVGPFSGELQVAGSGQGIRPVVSLLPGQVVRFAMPQDLTGLSPGLHAFLFQLVSSSGVLASETLIEHQVIGPRVRLLSSPAGQVLSPPALAPLRFVLRNEGDQPASGSLRFELFESSAESRFSIPPGEDAEILLPDFEVDADAEAKTYRGLYSIQTDGLPAETGAIDLVVLGIALEVTPSLDKSAYTDGDTAELTVSLSNSRPALGTDYLVRVHYGGFEETRSVTVGGSPTAAVFSIPLVQVTGEPIFLGVSHPSGRSLYINTVAVQRGDALVSLSTDQPVYAPGAAVTVSGSASAQGTLSLSGPGGYSESVPVSGAVSRSFALPTDLPGGTYFVSWSFSASDGRGSTGQVSFDVDGLRVRVFEAVLDRGRYGSGEAIESRLRVNTNRPAAVTLRAFSLDPDGISAVLGEASLSLTPEADLLATNAWSFSSAVAGLHRLVYGLYLGESLLASGGLAFDVGSAAVLGVRTDKADYPSPTEPVAVSVCAFVSGQATLRLEVDGSAVATQDVTGAGVVDLPLSLSGLPPGSHELVAVLEGGGYSSRRSTTFATGTSLPDLVVSPPTARPVSSSSWKVDITVTNIGRSDAPATTVAFSDVTAGGSLSLGSVSVPALAASASAVVSADWNVLGAAGTRSLKAAVDPGGSIQEFREDNNELTADVGVPKVVVQALSAPSYPANVEASLAASVVNLTADETLDGLALSAFVARPDGSLVSLGGAALAPLGPGAAASVPTPWSVGRSEPGNYALNVQLSSGTTTLGTSAASFQVAPTYAFSGSVSATPNPAPAGGAVTLSGQMQNQGNVAATGEAAFELVGTGGVIVERHVTPADVPLAGTTSVSIDVPSLVAPPGEYDLALRMRVGAEDLPVAQSRLTVSGATVGATLSSDETPRVLAYIGCSPSDQQTRERRRAFIEASLANSNVILETTFDGIEFARLFRSGAWNTYVVVADGPLFEPLLGDELREATFRGDGLIVVRPAPEAFPLPNLEPALGARVRSRLPGQSHVVNVLASPLGPAFAVTVPGAISRIELQGAGVAGVTTPGTTPVLTFNAFGLGRSVAIGFDPAVSATNPGRAALEGLFARAVAYAAPQDARAEAAGAVLPLSVNLVNPTALAQTADVSVSLPTGVTLVRVDDSPTDPGIPAWQVSVPAGETVRLRFEVGLPDLVGTFEIGTSVLVNGIAINDPPTFTLSVQETAETALARVVAEIDALSLPPGERGHRNAALALLRVAQAAPAQLLELRIRLAAEAGQKLGRIQSVDVSGIRVVLDQVIAAWERRWFERLVSQRLPRDPRHTMSIGGPPGRTSATRPPPRAMLAPAAESGRQ